MSPGSLQVKLIVALLAVLVATASPARERLSPYPPGTAARAGDDDSDAAPPVAPAWRATQVNRCTDVKGRIKLQDVPCSPLAQSPAEPTGAAATAGAVELSSLAPRPSVESSRAPARAAEPNGFASILLAVAWKLGLFLAVGYAIFRLIRAWREAYLLAPPPDKAPAAALRRTSR
jgi:hypothetical protein